MHRTRTAGVIRRMSLPVALALTVGACGSGTPTTAPTTGPTTVATPGAETPGATQGTGTPTNVPSGETSALDEACRLGSEEGQLVRWHGHSEATSAVYAAFHEQYPEIEVEQLSMTPDDQAQRVLIEHSAGRELTPDLSAGNISAFSEILAAGLVDTETDWTTLGVPDDLIHPDSNITRIHRMAIGLGYNTDKLTPEQLPDTWEELIDAQWNGRVIVDPRGRPFDQLSLVWGADEAMDYIARLKDVVNPLVIEGGTTGLVAVAGGEADITTGGRSAETLEQQANGAPIALKYLDAVPAVDDYDIVYANSRHPNAAKCYIGWFASQGGQEIYNEIEFKTNDTVLADAPADAQIVTVERPEDATAVSEIGREMGRFWTGQ